MNTPESKVAAVISYLTWIGWIAAVIMRSDREEYKGCEFTRRHINQAFFINITGIILIAVSSGIIMAFPYYGFRFTQMAYFLYLLIWLVGFSRAVRGIWKPLPIVGEVELIK